MRDKSTARSENLEAMATVSRQIRILCDARLRETGLTLAKARALLRITHGGAANQTELAEELEIETAALGRLIDGVETQRLIEQWKVEGDRRAKHAVLAGLRVTASRLAAMLFKTGMDDLQLGISDMGRSSC